jgi:hypothetical protein
MGQILPLHFTADSQISPLRYAADSRDSPRNFAELSQILSLFNAAEILPLYVYVFTLEPCLCIFVYSRELDLASVYLCTVENRVDKKSRFQFFVKYDYRFLLDVIIAIIAEDLACVIIMIITIIANTK